MTAFDVVWNGTLERQAAEAARQSAVDRTAAAAAQERRRVVRRAVSALVEERLKIGGASTLDELRTCALKARPDLDSVPTATMRTAIYRLMQHGVVERLGPKRGGLGARRSGPPARYVWCGRRVGEGVAS